MNDSDFAPGGRVPAVWALANAPLRRSDLASLVSELSNTDSEGVRDQSQSGSIREGECLWGLVYAHEDTLGFYVHPETTQMYGLYNRGGLFAQTIDLAIPAVRVISAALEAKSPEKTPIGRFLRRITGEKARVLRIEWTARGQIRRLSLRVERGSESLEPFLARLFPRRG